MIHGCMKSIPAATPITLTKEEHAELEGLARSTKTEHRLRQRARIVLLSAAGLATRAIGREVGCTTGTASKWRVRYAERRRPGLDETGDRGNEPKYTDATDKRLLAVLDRPIPAGLRALEWAADRQSPRRRRCAICLALLAHPQDRSRRTQELVRKQRSRFRGQSGCGGRPLHEAARKCSGSGRRREAVDPSAGALAGLSEDAERPGADWPVARLHPAWHDDALRRFRHCDGQGDGASVQAAATA